MNRVNFRRRLLAIAVAAGALLAALLGVPAAMAASHPQAVAGTPAPGATPTPTAPGVPVTDTTGLAPLPDEGWGSPQAGLFLPADVLSAASLVLGGAGGGGDPCAAVLTPTDSPFWLVEPTAGYLVAGKPHNDAWIAATACNNPAPNSLYTLWGPAGQAITVTLDRNLFYRLPADAAAGSYTLTVQSDLAVMSATLAVAAYQGPRVTIRNPPDIFSPQRPPDLQVDYSGFKGRPAVAVEMYRIDENPQNSPPGGSPVRFDLIGKWQIRPALDGSFHERVRIPLAAPQGSYTLVACILSDCTQLFFYARDAGDAMDWAKFSLPPRLASLGLCADHWDARRRRCSAGDDTAHAPSVIGADWDWTQIVPGDRLRYVWSIDDKPVVDKTADAATLAVWRSQGLGLSLTFKGGSTLPNGRYNLVVYLNDREEGSAWLTVR